MAVGPRELVMFCVTGNGVGVASHRVCCAAGLRRTEDRRGRKAAAGSRKPMAMTGSGNPGVACDFIKESHSRNPGMVWRGKLTIEGQTHR